MDSIRNSVRGYYLFCPKAATLPEAEMIENRPENNSWSIWAALDLRLSKMVPKLAMWSIRGPWVQYMYRDWRPIDSQTCRGLSVRLGDSLHRAESPWHVHGQRAHGPNIAIEASNLQVGQRGPLIRNKSSAKRNR